MEWTSIGSFVAAATAAFAALYTLKANRKKLEAEATKVLTEAATELVDDMRSEIAALRKRVDKMRHDLDYERRRNYALEAWAKALVAQVSEMGHNPTPYGPHKDRYFQ